MLSTTLTALALFTLFRLNLRLRVSSRHGGKVELDFGVLTKGKTDGSPPPAI